MFEVVDSDKFQVRQFHDVPLAESYYIHKVEENKTLIINDDEVGHLVEEVFKGKSKKEIIMAINSLEEILQEVNNKEEKPKTKTKKL